MIYASTSLKETKEKNPHFCLSPLRTVECCYKCPTFRRDWFHGKSISQMRCKPKVSSEIKKLLTYKRKILKDLARIDKKLNEVNTSLGY